MALMMNDKIKAAEVELLDLEGQNLGYLATKKALQLAREQQADLVCINIMSSPHNASSSLAEKRSRSFSPNPPLQKRKRKSD